MEATLQIGCRHDAPAELEWANELNKRCRPPVALVDGREHQLRWDETTEVAVTAGESHHVHVYFEVLGILRWGGADLDTPKLSAGETVRVEYSVSLKDRYLSAAHLQLAG